MIQVPGVGDAGSRAVLCRVDDIQENGAICVDIALNGEEHAFIVTRADGQVHAYHNICPHAGRRLDWAPGKVLLKERVLVCAVHGACFRIETGLCIGGPCRGEHLSRVGVQIIGDDVLLAEHS